MDRVKVMIRLPVGLRSIPIPPPPLSPHPLPVANVGPPAVAPGGSQRAPLRAPSPFRFPLPQTEKSFTAMAAEKKENKQTGDASNPVTKRKRKRQDALSAKRKLNDDDGEWLPENHDDGDGGFIKVKKQKLTVVLKELEDTRRKMKDVQSKMVAWAKRRNVLKLNV
jgi:hypothetical protein